MQEELKKYFSENGRKGGEKVKEKYGPEYFKNLANKRWEKKKEELSTDE